MAKCRRQVPVGCSAGEHREHSAGMRAASRAISETSMRWTPTPATAEDVLSVKATRTTNLRTCCMGPQSGVMSMYHGPSDLHRRVPDLC